MFGQNFYLFYAYLASLYTQKSHNDRAKFLNQKLV